MSDEVPWLANELQDCRFSDALMPGVFDESSENI